MSLQAKVKARVQDGGLFWPLVGLVIITAVFYVYCVNRTVILVAERNKIETSINEHRAEITNLEADYMDQTSKITLEVATALGYGEASRTIYVQKKAVSVLSLAETVQ
ncbi:MAG TPA: hypothetical protein VK145_01710 [Candidatus Nanoarchaeia archaeon]|nr:hypothetical protein [Candidatus Nanoarchaeia archaeon]